MNNWSPLNESPTGAYWLGRDADEHGGKRSDNPFAAHEDAEMARQWDEEFGDGASDAAPDAEQRFHCRNAQL